MPAVTVREFSFHGPSGLERLHCKFCGVLIADMKARPMGRIPGPVEGTFVDQYVMKFCRLPNYGEAKIACKAKKKGMFSAHVTNGCMDCLQKQFTKEELQECIKADEDDMGFLQSSHGEPVKIVKILAGGGIP